MGKLIDRVGNKYNRLTVLSRVENYRNSTGTSIVMYNCKCDCGNFSKVSSNELSSGGTKSCGCLQKESVSKAHTKHMMCGTPEYNSYNNMISRCTKESNQDYEHYGGRGITVSSEWLESFENFYKDMGNKPSKSHTLERIDVNGDYEVSNCIWILQHLQKRNQRKRKDNTSGVVGVYLDKGSCWKATWCEDGKSRVKSFNIKTFGDELAFFAACEYREQQINLLNLQGAGYSKNHGL